MKKFLISDFDFPGGTHNGIIYPKTLAADKMNFDFLEMLDTARWNARTPFLISSGYRPQDFDKAKHGITCSDHAQGCGVDIACTTADNRFSILQHLIKAGFRRLGISWNHIHVGGTMSTNPQDVFWIE